MATEFKRFTVSVTPELERKLDKMKKEQYYNQSQSKMVRDLIIRGLMVKQSGQTDNADVKCCESLD